MKKTILLIYAVCFVSLQLVFAQKGKITDPKVPVAVTNAFNAKYPNMKVTDWDYEADKNAYKGKFKMNGKEMEAFFSADGEWMKTKTDIKREQLPVAVSKAIAAGEYSSWSMSDFAELDTPEGKHYKVKVRKGVDFDYLKYDTNGKLLERKDKKHSDDVVK
jgi:hypothetical protein